MVKVNDRIKLNMQRINPSLKDRRGGSSLVGREPSHYLTDLTPVGGERKARLGRDSEHRAEEA